MTSLLKTLLSVNNWQFSNAAYSGHKEGHLRHSSRLENCCRFIN